MTRNKISSHEKDVRGTEKDPSSETFIGYMKEVFFLVGERNKKFILMVSLFLLSSMLELLGLGLIVPYVSVVLTPESAFDQYAHLFSIFGNVVTNAEEMIYLISLLLLSVFTTKAISAVLINREIVKFCYTYGADLKVSLMERYQSLSYVEYIERNSSDYIYNIQVLADGFSLGVLRSILRFISEGIVIVVILSFLAWKSIVAFSTLFLLTGIAAFLYDSIFRNKIENYGRIVNENSTRIVRSVHEGIEGLKEIRVLGKEEYFSRLLDEGSRAYSMASIHRMVVSSLPKYMMELIIVSFLVLMVLITLISKEPINNLIPLISMFGLASIRLVPSANIAMNTFNEIRFGRHTVSRLYADMFNYDVTRKISNSNILKDHDISSMSNIRLDGVYYRYPEATVDSLIDINMEINAGESIGIIGTSGSGKTTILDLLLGLIEPVKGQVFYNNEPLFETVDRWRQQVAYLPQNVFLVDDTLRKNIALGEYDDNIDNMRIKIAIKKSRLDELVENMPNGIDTVLGERGIRMSGGQRQRVALARAFYHNRNVLIMDEATSALDNETEREIVEEVQQLKGKVTMMIIAHRISTLQHCDRIYRLEKGAIVHVDSYNTMCSRSLVNETF